MGDATVGTVPQSHPTPLWGQGRDGGGQIPGETWKKKCSSSIRWMGEMQRAPGLRVMQQHPGMEDAVIRRMGDAGCRQPWCQAQPSLAADGFPSTSLLRSCTTSCLSFPLGLGKGAGFPGVAGEG